MLSNIQNKFEPQLYLACSLTNLAEACLAGIKTSVLLGSKHIKTIFFEAMRLNNQTLM